MANRRSSPSMHPRAASAPRSALEERPVAEAEVSLNPLVASLRPSATVRLTDTATRLRESGVDVVALAAGEPDAPTPAAVAAAGIEAITRGITKYTPNSGTSALRAAIAAKLRSENGLAEVQDSWVVVSNGAKQAVWQAVQATCGPGDEVIVPAPYWVSYPEMARLAGAEPVVALARVVARHPRLLVLSDEIYEYLVYPPARHVSFGALPGMARRTLTVNGFSKAYSMTGWRLGYLAAPPPYAQVAAIIQSQTTSGASSIAQHAALAALGLGHGGGDPVARAVAATRQKRDRVVARLRAIPGIKLATPPGAFYAFPDASALVGPGVEAEGFGPVPDVAELCRYILECAHVVVVPGEAFGLPECFRISYATDLEQLERGMDRIAAALAPNKLRRTHTAA
ncbi:hypothetical protein QBZ16_003776 [Prototheca wickerhamii]|uniref:Aminotransferase class I/classII large domain-containing protein n=1 Tax=Prototheca wickerhamii TaxID=3111 RepID=A0AAD9II07_PROWI|nr:hypothetical protein QBZ16_003776 [Prototheca wickerhamii]